MEYREKQYINKGWRTSFESEPVPFEELPGKAFKDEDWDKTVDLPHNWEDYQGYRRLSHGNLHGTAWYSRKLEIPESMKYGGEEKHTFLEFEGAGSYMSLWVNGKYIGGHKGGRTCYTADITGALKWQGENQILVRTDHPEKIDDLPWVCGGCWGTPNTEGSQPLGIFRPVSCYQTGSVRVEPFGVAVICEKEEDGLVKITVTTEICSFREQEAEVTIVHRIKGPDGSLCAGLEKEIKLEAKGSKTDVQSVKLDKYELWDLDNPAVYEVSTDVIVKDGVSDHVRNSFGIRFLEWENFGDDEGQVLDQELLTARPGRENHYFNEVVKCSSSPKVRITDGGVQIRLSDLASEDTVIEIETEVENLDTVPHRVELESFVQTYNRTKSIADLKQSTALQPGERKIIFQKTESLQFLDRWSETAPYYHQVASTLRDLEGRLTEPMQVKTPFGVYRTEETANKAYPYKQPARAGEKRHRFFLNGKPVLINGTCEYEHLMGNDHAFDTEQIEARMRQIRAAGFNAFREAHCPHNLRYMDYCDRNGILYWAQMGAHLYFDTEEFRENFRNLTREWVRERRNSPSLILWGIQNESMLPESFTAELTREIRELDPTTSEQRKTATCNGGSGSDWNIPQNWSGTYGGTVSDYGADIRRQKLVGEYGQYRVLGKHEEGIMEERQNTGGDVSEELFCYCLQKKVEEIEKQKNYVAGHFQWIFNAHANPGRETLYCLDGRGSNAVGVVNSKGLLTSWGEPTDCFYMYRSHYTSGRCEPMIYIVSHTWPDRFIDGPRTCDVTVYSNCDVVELYNDYESRLLGKKRRGSTGVPFLFENVSVERGMLYAVGYVDGQPAARDTVLLEGLLEPENAERLYEGALNLTLPAEGREDGYLYRVNCGGNDYEDVNGNKWYCDRKWTGRGYGWTSWGMEYDNVEDEIGSEGRTYDPITNSQDQELFQSYRYGREKLAYHFEAEPGEYELELYFTEPWYGIGGGMDCRGWRIFDVAVNGEKVIENLDIWQEAGCLKGLKKSVKVKIKEKELVLHFPRIRSYQAVICAVAVRRCLEQSKNAAGNEI